MNLGEAKQRVRDSLAAILGDIDTPVLNFINDAIRDIHAAGRWPWDRRGTTFTTRGDIAGTATWVQGALTVAISTGNPATQALANEYIRGLIKLAGANVYEITAWDQSTSTITLASEILEASTGGTPTAFQVIQDMVTLPATVESVIDVIDHLFPRVLAKHVERWQRLWPDPFLVIGGLPDRWWAKGVDATGNVEIVLYPPPDTNRVYMVDFWRRPAFPTNDADDLAAVTGIPERFQPTIIAGAKYRAFEFEFETDTVKAAAYGEFQRGLANMRAYGRTDSGIQRVLRSDRVRVFSPFDRRQDEYHHTDRVTGV